MKRSTGTILLFILGLVSLAFLVTLVRDNVFFSGDAGMKFILVQHFAAGDLSPLVAPKAPAWVNSLWHEGFFPFDPPFGYQQPVGMYVAYPLYFPLITTPFYVLMGWRGLYALPMLAVIGTWLVVLYALRLARVSKWAEWFALAALIFSSPFSLYGAMFWEHTLSVFFVAFTLPYIVSSLDGTIRWPAALLWGTLSAISVFFRAETGALLLIVGAAGFWINGRARWRSSVAFGAGLGIGVGLFVLANQIAYGIPTGVHSLQLLERDLWSAKRVRDMWSDVSDMLPRLLGTTPLLVAGLITFPVAWRNAAARPEVRRQLAWSAAITLAVLVFSPLLLPSDGHKQWGARFYLILLPWSTMTLAFLVEALQRGDVRSRGEGAEGRVLPEATAGKPPLSTAWRYAAGGLLVAGLLGGLYSNGVDGVRTVRDDYAGRVLPALEVVREQPVRAVIVTHQWIAQELASLFFDRDFFWLREDEDLPRLLESLRAQGVDEALYLTYEPGSNRHRPIDFGDYLGPYGTYWVYRLAIE